MAAQVVTKQTLIGEMLQMDMSRRLSPSFLLTGGSLPTVLKTAMPN